MDYGFPILRKGGERRLGAAASEMIRSSLVPSVRTFHHHHPSWTMLHQTDRKIFIANNVDESEQELLVDYPPTYDLTRDIGDLICPRTKNRN